MFKPAKFITFTALFFLIASFSVVSAAPKKEFYEIRIYHVKNSDQEASMEKYLRDAYVPAMHRAGIKNVGVFKPVASDTSAGKLIYVLTPLKSLDHLLALPKTLEKDAAYLAAGKDYIDAAYNNPPYTRFESIVLESFRDMPVLKLPNLSVPKSERVYELRSYEGHTEKIHRNKVKMFNDGGEIPLFDRLGFNSVFYGSVISGSHMPNLMYMTTFSDKASRDAHWKSFFEDAVWLKLKANPEYQNNVSKNTIFFLYPTEYSDI